MAGSVRPKAASFAIVATGTHADVRLSPKAKGEFDKINAATHELAIKQSRELERFMGRFCNSPNPNLGNEKYKKEGDFPDGSGGKVAVHVFKPFKWRLYGAVLNIKGRKCFVGVRVDPDKKQDKADQPTLRLTASDIGQLEEYGEG